MTINTSPKGLIISIQLMYLFYLILVLILFIYNITGIYIIIPFILAILNFIVATINLIGDHKNISYRLIQLISLIIIIFIIILNIKLLIFGSNLYKLAFIIPFSINKITFFDDIYSNNKNEIYYIRNSYINRIYFHDHQEISDLLYNLEDNKIYVITFDFIISWLQYEEDSPVINLCKPILITKHSNPRLISDFIQSKIRIACDNYYLNDDIMDKLIEADGPGVIAKYSELYLL